MNRQCNKAVFSYSFSSCSIKNTKNRKLIRRKQEVDFGHFASIIPLRSMSSALDAIDILHFFISILNELVDFDRRI